MQRNHTDSRKFDSARMGYVYAWDMSMQVGHGYNSCPSVIVVTLLRMSCNMHLFDKDLLTHIEIERLVTDLCHL